MKKLYNLALRKKDNKQIKTYSDINRILYSYLESYEKDQEPIGVNFREIFPNLNNPDRFSHLIHPYPAKVLLHIPYFFLNNEILVEKEASVLDPFCGSGTILLESLLANKNSFGVDSNPLARLISKVKTFRYEEKELFKLLMKLESITSGKNVTPSVVNIDYWFLPRVKSQLVEILGAVKNIDNEDYRSFFLVCFSNCVRKVSLADPRVSVPVRIKLDHYPENHPFRKKNVELLEQLNFVNVKNRYLEIVKENIRRVATLNSINNNKKCKIVSTDAKSLINPTSKGFEGLKQESIDLILTSPPYSGAQKYIRSSSLNLGWTELATISELKELDNLSIGRENYRKADYNKLLLPGISKADKIITEIYDTYPLRAHIASKYLLEMKDALRESYRVLKKGGILVLVVGNNQVCGKEFKTQEYLQNIIEDMGAKVILRLIDDIKSYGLMTKRNKTANIITREWILVFQKPN